MSENPFKVGDAVVALDDDDFITAGKPYVVERASYSVIKITDDDGETREFPARYFRLAEPARVASADMVNSPPHYTAHPSGIECIQITEHMGFCLGNAIKYLWRADLKGGVEDLEKSVWYIQREIAKRKAAK